MPKKQTHNAKPAKDTTPMHGKQNHSYGEGTAKSVVAKLHK